MAILIDGYNLLHAADVFPPECSAGTLHAARQALLQALVEVLPPRDLLRTTIVFDATHAPPGLPRQFWYHGLNVLFAANHADADALIEQLIDESPAPRELQVVSSDHRLHRAARRRKASVCDSGPWFAEQVARAKAAPRAASSKPQQMPSESEVQFWLEKFGTIEEADELISPPGAAADASDEQAAPDSTKRAKRDSAWDERAAAEDNPYYPFPPNFADGLFDEE